MSVKTVRFNKSEEVILRKVLAYYHKDFSSCIKEMILDKMEDLQDIGVIQRIREGAKKDYRSAEELNRLF